MTTTFNKIKKREDIALDEYKKVKAELNWFKEGENYRKWLEELRGKAYGEEKDGIIYHVKPDGTVKRVKDRLMLQDIQDSYYIVDSMKPAIFNTKYTLLVTTQKNK